ncbi:MAG: hypothetical protein K0R54_850 [Clostridiaceae bacterium]|jgi:tRNA nucleotidyltransferase (CCA-adding enzyme)|nr:hypothetical protein [Clostridiaceae bacterium]
MNKIKISIPNDVKYILDTLDKEGYEAYIVGGCVRDSIIGRKPLDWDITTNSLPENVIDIFKNKQIKVIETGLKHGTVTIVMNNVSYEITTFRIDSEYLDNRHPKEVTFTCSIQQDLSRRDFTINAMAYNESTGVLDYFNGLGDINNKVIKCVGNAGDRFNEDALRMLRAVRFSCQLNFSLEPVELLNSIKKNSYLIKNISSERIRDELCKILLSYKPSKGIIDLYNSNLLSYIIPELIPCVGFDQSNIHHDKDIFKHTLSVVDRTPAELAVRLAALLHDIGKVQCFTLDDKGQGHFYGHEKVSGDISKEILKRLKFDNITVETVSHLIYEHMRTCDIGRSLSIKKFINNVGVENLNNLFSLQIADRKSSAKEYSGFQDILELKEKCETIINKKIPLSLKDLNVNGEDLIKIGIPRGKRIGDVLNKLLELVLIDPQLNKKEMLIDIAKKY